MEKLCGLGVHDGVLKRCGNLVNNIAAGGCHKLFLAKTEKLSAGSVHVD